MPKYGPDDTQVLLVELQPKIVAAAVTVPGEQLQRATSMLMKLASAAGIPVTVSAVPLDEETPKLIDELEAVAPLMRSTVSVFDDPMIAERLRSSRRNVLAVGGISSEIAVLHAVVDARAAGFEVHVLTDLCGGLDPRTEQAAFGQMRSVGATFSSIASFATGLAGDMASDCGRAIMQALDQYYGWGALTQALESSLGAEVKTIVDELSAAWRVGDAKRFAAPFSDDARFVAFDGSVLVGPEQIAAYHERPFATHLAHTDLGFEKLDVRPIGGLTCIVASEGGILRQGRAEGELIGLSAQTFVLNRQRGQLRIIAFQNTRIRPLDGPAAAEAWKEFDERWTEVGRAG